MKIAFYDTKPYDRLWFSELGPRYGAEIRYFESRLTADTAPLASGCGCVCAFVNDTLDARTIDALCALGVRLIAMRCAGFNNVDCRAAKGKLPIVRVPAYSPHAVAEHAAGLLLCLNRKLHRAFNRTRDFNFSISGLEGFDLCGKTAGIIGTGRIGRCFADICRGFGMRVLAYDPMPAEGFAGEYVSVGRLCRESDVLSLHCPLTPDTHRIINADTIALMKDGAVILNTSRGALIDSEALLAALKTGKLGGAGLDVYEEEAALFFEDNSGRIVQDDVLARLLSLPNVLLTSHQAFLTREALYSIARTTLENIAAFERGEPLENEVRV